MITFIVHPVPQDGDVTSISTLGPTTGFGLGAAVVGGATGFAVDAGGGVGAAVDGGEDGAAVSGSEGKSPSPSVIAISAQFQNSSG
eukprot:m.31844 g.31844  ORF g.31844 m.31844 type:complete len:86 (-) comp14054_c0_seq1:1043-1300(-)